MNIYKSYCVRTKKGINEGSVCYYKFFIVTVQFVTIRLTVGGWGNNAN